MNFKPHQAASDGDIEAIKRRLRETTNVNEKDGGGWTALHCAVHGNQFEIAEIILRHPNICVHTVNQTLTTCLHYAARSSRTTPKFFEILNLLLEHGFLFQS